MMNMLNDLHARAVALICAFDSAVPASKASCKSRSAGMRVHLRLRTDDEGSSLVEFAIVLPMLVLFLTGIFSIGTAFEHQQSLVQAVGIAAAQLSQSRTTSVDPCAETWKAIKQAAPNLNPASLSVTITMNGSSAATNATSCTGSLAALTSAQPGSVTVLATYPCSVQLAGVTVAPITCTATTTEFEY